MSRSRYRSLTTRHPVHGTSYYQIDADAMASAIAFENWGIVLRVKGPTEDLEIECDSFTISEPKEYPDEFMWDPEE